MSTRSTGKRRGRGSRSRGRPINVTAAVINGLAAGMRPHEIAAAIDRDLDLVNRVIARLERQGRLPS